MCCSSSTFYSNVAITPNHCINKAPKLRNHFQVHLCTLGPLTNLAKSIQYSGERFLVQHLSRVVIMGGSANGLGNVTRSAEFNIRADPEAARVVFGEQWRDGQVCVASWDLCKKYVHKDEH